MDEWVSLCNGQLFQSFNVVHFGQWQHTPNTNVGSKKMNMVYNEVVFNITEHLKTRPYITITYHTTLSIKLTKRFLGNTY